MVFLLYGIRFVLLDDRWVFFGFVLRKEILIFGFYSVYVVMVML